MPQAPAQPGLRLAVTAALAGRAVDGDCHWSDTFFDTFFGTFFNTSFDTFWKIFGPHGPHCLLTGRWPPDPSPGSRGIRRPLGVTC
ncbi:hypothetical protein GCM10022232_36220 [Streptomyces plumbiresistens]|uniref:Uncharacterized protein n=1 Tax=Streptomyces plumbiresistens TaxID=511811 RepID=A0ABP7REF1_9ACTN